MPEEGNLIGQTSFVKGKKAVDEGQVISLTRLSLFRTNGQATAATTHSDTFGNRWHSRA
jgi:hypothetical protein